MTADEYLREVKNKYRSLTCYRDRGVAYPIGREDDGVIFETEFERNCYYRIHYSFYAEKWEKQINHHISYDYRTVSLKGDWEDFQTVIDRNDPNSLSDVLATSTGISLGATLYIPALLMADAGGFEVTDIREAKLLSGNGAEIIAGSHPWRDNCRVVVTFEDMLVKSIEEPNQKFRIEFEVEAQ